MVTEIQPTEINYNTYEPTVQDRIQRVLYRLDNGELLIDGSLQRQGNFCVLGLFADEYPNRTWLDDTFDFADPIDGKLISACMDDVLDSNAFALTERIADYYGFKDVKGSFVVDDIPDGHLKERLEAMLPNNGAISLDKLNDLLVFGLPNNYAWNANAILAGVIRSGALFNKESD